MKVGNAQGFWGDSPSAPADLVKQQPDLDYLTLDYLAEVSMSILAIQMQKDPSAGFARDFLGVVKELIPLWNQGAKVKIVTNAGGLNPESCARACQEILSATTNRRLKIGVVSGDDVLHIFDVNHRPFVTANAYLGAEPIAEALKQGADIVITGRVADPSLTVGPCMYHFGWQSTDYDKIAQATVAGHLIECGRQVTGGISTQWVALNDLVRIGFPIVEFDPNGSFIITKPVGTGGSVNIRTVKEQLVYEISDPGCYLSPDVTVSMLGLILEEVGPDRVRLQGAVGSKATDTYKVSATFRDGYKAETMVVIAGPDPFLKATLAAEAFFERLKADGIVFKKSHYECLGRGDAVPVWKKLDNAPECVLRLAVIDPEEMKVERFTKEIASLVTVGPQGVTGYASGRAPVRPVFGFEAGLISKEKVAPKVVVI